jgi:hypothetical protein
MSILTQGKEECVNHGQHHCVAPPNAVMSPNRYAECVETPFVTGIYCATSLTASILGQPPKE